MEIATDLREKIVASVEAGFDEQIAFTRKLVSFASQRGEEHAIQDYIFQQMRQRGYVMDRFAMDKEALAAHPGSGAWSDMHSNAPIVVGIHHPRAEKGRSLILQAHLDVVPIGPRDMWELAPYSGEIIGEWMYGRGAADMKAGAAANLFALDALRRIGLQPAATVYVQSVVEEESTGNGALMTHLRGYKADAALIPEPEDEQLVRANIGAIWFRIEVTGVPAHVQDMGTGANAIDAAYRVIGQLREMEKEWNARAKSDTYFGDDPHPLNLNIGKIEGGDWASSVPAWCAVDCRIAILPGTNAHEAAREIEARIADFARSDPYLSNNPPKVTFNGFRAEGYVLQPGSEAEAALGRAHKVAFAKPLTERTARAYLDARVYALFDQVPALCYGPLGKDIHGFNECVNLPSVKRITAAMALFIAEWCGIEPSGQVASDR